MIGPGDDPRYAVALGAVSGDEPSSVWKLRARSGGATPEPPGDDPLGRALSQNHGMSLTKKSGRIGENMTRIIVMPETLSLSYVKAHLSEIADRVEGEHERVTVTRNGRATAVLVSPDDLESLEETLAVLSDPELMRQIREGEAAVEAGEVATLEDLQVDLKRRRDTAA